MDLKNTKWMFKQGLAYISITKDEKPLSLEMKPSLAIFISCNWGIRAALSDCSLQSSFLPSDEFLERSQWLPLTNVLMPQCCLRHLCNQKCNLHQRMRFVEFAILRLLGI